MINGERLNDPKVLEEGDVIDVGHSRMVFTYRKVEGQLSAFRHLKRRGEQHRGTLVDTPSSKQQSDEVPDDAS